MWIKETWWNWGAEFTLWQHKHFKLYVRQLWQCPSASCPWGSCTVPSSPQIMPTITPFCRFFFGSIYSSALLVPKLCKKFNPKLFIKQECFSPKRKSVLGSLNKMLTSASLSYVFVKLTVLPSKSASLKNGRFQECGSKMVSGQRMWKFQTVSENCKCYDENE